jgi:hypothetical protein
MAGRPTDCTPELAQRLAAAIRLGLPYERACEAVGIHYATMRRWIQRAEAEDARLADNPKARPRASEQVFCDFRDTVSRAEAAGELENAARVFEAGKGGDWRAAAWILERRHPARWAQNAELAAELEALRQLLQERINNDANKPRDPPTD